MKDEFFIIHNSLICIKINSNIFIILKMLELKNNAKSTKLGIIYNNTSKDNFELL